MKTQQQDSLFLNRGLSWLEFNQRVLNQAFEKENPLLERLKFLAIVSSNLDEFFEVHIAALRQQYQSHKMNRGPDGMSPKEELEALTIRIHQQVESQYRCWREEVLPALNKEGIFFHRYSELSEEEKKYFSNYFREFIFPTLTPLAIDPSHPFPQLPNLSLSLIVSLEGEGMSADLAMVPIPTALPLILPFSCSGQHHKNQFVFLESIIREHLDDLFCGMTIKGAYLFRLTRNSNLTIDEEESDNLLHAIEEELRHVQHNAPIRLEIEKACPEAIVKRLLHLFHLHQSDLYFFEDVINLKQFLPLAFELDRPDLREKRFSAANVISLSEEADIFWHLRKRDILLHHPYDSFQTVADFLGHAAEDPHTISIKQTLYRTSNDSPLVSSLITAARNGKQVTVVIELKARFDEAANIKWARMMREAGINVIYGLSGLKTHAKAMLIVRQEGEIIRRYAHLGTGNYHPSTARIYTDLGVLTSRESLTADVATMFNILTGVSKLPEMKELILAPYVIRERLLALIDREIEHAQAGRPSGMYLKMNALVEESMIKALYRASQAGVPIRLLVRGVCCLRPGLPGVSETIEVRSIVGRFLEHSRILRFENGGSPELFLSSADWMPRNLFRRVETCFPLLNDDVKAHVEEILEWFWKDNVKARVMDQDGYYHCLPITGERFNVQQTFIEDAQRRKKLLQPVTCNL
ncbi:MAG: polyphosphate kinase 1 [Chthoniobacterales bacterium]|nr:polyphosphate kinase 1 [Chthoniobacterales bacterium]